MLEIKFRKKQVFLLVAAVVATCLFIYHSTTIVGRHLKYEILEVHSILYNKSLPMPIVTMQLDSRRHPNSTRPYTKISFDVSLQSVPLPDWSYQTYGEDATAEKW